MKIELNQEEINTALTEFVSNMGVDLTDRIAEVDITAGRGANGNTATVAITKNETSGVVRTEAAEEVTEKAEDVVAEVEAALESDTPLTEDAPLF